jgi:putative aldouronate transport system substrate-binding protein
MCKKLLLLLFMTILAFGSVFANGQKDSAPAASAGGLEPYEVKWWFLNWGGVEEGLLTAIEEEANKSLADINATLNITIGDGNVHSEQFPIKVNSGEVLDITFTAKWWKYEEWVAEGYLTDITDMMHEIAPETVALLGEDVFIKGSAIDGRNYAVPTLKETCVPGGWNINVQFMDEIGMDYTKITKSSDLTPYLAAGKAARPDVYPYNTAGLEWPDIPFVPLDTDYASVWLDGRTKKVFNSWETKEMMDFLKLKYEWFQKGYLNPDAALETFDANAVRNAGNFLIEWQPVKGKNIKAKELQSAATPGLVFEDHEAPNQRWVVSQHMSGSMQAIPVTSDDPERAMMVIDKLHTNADFINALSFGVEGVHYKKTSKPGIIELTDNNVQGKLPQWMLGNVFLQYITTQENPDKNKALKEVVDTAKVNFANGFYINYEPVQDTRIAVAAATKELSKSLSVGVLDPEIYLPQLIDAIKAAGGDTLLAEYNKQLSAFLAAQ